MKGIKLHILSAVLLATLAILVTPTEALAVVQSLNGQTGQTQTFQNDTNVTISSSNNIHSLGWQGLLGVSRGGTGASSFTSGSLLFSNGTSISQDNSNLFWDNINKRLGIGTSSPISTLDVIGNTKISGSLDVTGDIIGSNLLRLGVEGGEGDIHGIDAITTDTAGGVIYIYSGNGVGSGYGGELSLAAGSGGTMGNGGELNLDSGTGGSTSGNGGSISETAGSARLSGNGGNVDLAAGHGGNTSGAGGNITLLGGLTVGEGNGGDIFLWPGRAYGTGLNGRVKIGYFPDDTRAVLDISSIVTSEKTFTFPDVSGTFGLLETDQTWSGLNRFEANTNSTIYVGSSVKSGCIALGDSDGSGVTYITANDGVLTASATKPSVCQ